MKKNNKGFFLAETIVVIALVTTVMAFVYPNVTKLYDNYVNRTKYYDQTEDLYFLRAFSDYLYQKYQDDTGNGNSTLKEMTNNGCRNFTSEAEGGTMQKIYDNKKWEPNSCFDGTDGNGSCSIISKTINDNTDLKTIYITSYMASPSSNNYNFNRYLKRMKKTTYDSSSYRLIGVFEKKDSNDNNKVIEVRYASIKIDNPNPYRDCNLGGE